MLTNFHTHTTFCDGKATAEDMVLSALETGFCSPDTLCGMFEQTKLWLKEIGFRQYYALIGGAFTAVDL